MASSCEFRAWSARASPALCRNHAASFASIASCPGPSARWGAKELLGGDSAPAGGGGPAPAPEVLSTRCCRRCSSPSARRPSAPKRTPAPLSCASRTSSAKAGGSLPRVAPGMAGPSTESSAAAARSASAAARDPSAGPKRDLPSAADEAGAGDALASSAPAGPGRGWCCGRRERVPCPRVGAGAGQVTFRASGGVSGRRRGGAGRCSGALGARGAFLRRSARREPPSCCGRGPAGAAEGGGGALGRGRPPGRRRAATPATPGGGGLGDRRGSTAAVGAGHAPLKPPGAPPRAGAVAGGDRGERGSMAAAQR